MDHGRSVHVVTLAELLEERKDTILSRWVDAVLSAYPPDSAELFRRQKDPFANPLGDGVRTGTRGVFEVLLYGREGEEIESHLDKIVRLRAVQELTPSEALSFVFSLRTILRDVIPEAETDVRLRKGLTRIDEKIDAVALTAFELYAARREELSQLRVREVKRQVAWVFDKMRQGAGGPDEGLEASDEEAFTSDIAEREDLP